MSELNVSFQIETDNKENFSSTIAFQTFKKQRDMFYDILRNWEENHLEPGWTFQIALGNKIRNMLTLHNDATNYCHFARLFKSQLLISCIKNGNQESALNDEGLSVLESLKHSNPDKLTRLQERLVMPLSQKDSVHTSFFPGIQEFYKDFIIYAFNPIFYVHLEDCLVTEIMELNDTEFAGSEIEDSGTSVDEQTKQSFINCLASLRLMAKILGFLISLPYRSQLNSSDAAFSFQLELRKKVSPSLNLQECIQNSITQGKLALAVPWVVLYLAIMDPGTLCLPYYKQTLELLYCIHRVSINCISNGNYNFMNKQTANLIKSTLGWFFELPNFPTDSYLMWQSTCKSKDLKALGFNDKQTNFKNVQSLTSDVETTKLTHSLDRLQIIDDRVLHMCCPFLKIAKAQSRQGSTKSKSNVSGKRITPISSQLVKTTSTTNLKNLELKLEESFFHGQPGSTRKSVDFVAERVGSTCVKHICNSLLPSVREKNLKEFQEIYKTKKIEKLQCQQSYSMDSRAEYPTLAESHKKLQQPNTNNKEGSLDCVDSYKSFLTAEMNTLAAKCTHEIKEQCEQHIPSMCETRVREAIKALLPEETLEPVQEMCTQIATRMAMERVYQWIQSHIVCGALFTKDMSTELTRLIKNNNCATNYERRRHHNSEAASPTNVISDLRAYMCELMDNNSSSLTPDMLFTALNNLYTSLTERKDLLSGSEKIIYSMSIDFSLFLVSRRMDLFTPAVQERFIKLWTISYLEIPETDSPLSRYLCPRNVMLLCQVNNSEIWPAYGKFIRQLLANKLLSIKTLSDQCIALFRRDWPIAVLKNISKCLLEAVEDYNTSDANAEKIKFLIGWVAEMCCEIQFSY